MHVVFIPYGIKQAVDHLLMDMQAQKFPMPVYSPDGKEKKEVWIQGALRLAPFGIYEYVFPKEQKDVVLTTLRFNEKIPYNIKPVYLKMVKNALHIKEPGEFKTDQRLMWIMDNTSIIPLGIREDSVIEEPETSSIPKWTHEAV